MKITPAIARIHAHICADGCAYVSKVKRSPGDLKSHKRKNHFKNEYILEYWNNCLELLNEILADFKNEFNRKTRIKKRNYIRINGAKKIMQDLNLMKKNSYNWFIPKNILNASRKIIANWIRAFFDDEASVEINRTRIRVKSMNKNGLKQILLLLNKLNIKNKITGPNCDKSWYLTINQSYIKVYDKKIGFLHPEKKKKLTMTIKR